MGRSHLSPTLCPHQNITGLSQGRASNPSPFPAPTSRSWEGGDGKAHPAWKIRKQLLFFHSLPPLPGSRPTHILPCLGHHTVSITVGRGCSLIFSAQAMEDALVPVTLFQDKDIKPDPHIPRRAHSLGAISQVPFPCHSHGWWKPGTPRKTF